MKITITFNANDDLSTENKNRMMGSILTAYEAILAEFNGTTLTYRTDLTASEVIGAWEYEGFNIDEFELFSFSR